MKLNQQEYMKEKQLCQSVSIEEQGDNIAKHRIYSHFCVLKATQYHIYIQNYKYMYVVWVPVV